jgi:hypothetical protein
MFAIPAGTIGPADPRDTNPSAEWQFVSFSGDNVAHNLMARDQWIAPLRQFAFGDVQVGPADPASASLE